MLCIFVLLTSSIVESALVAGVGGGKLRRSWICAHVSITTAEQTKSSEIRDRTHDEQKSADESIARLHVIVNSLQ
jgi:hypothetical protein